VGSGGQSMPMPFSLWAARLAPFVLLFFGVFVAQHLEGLCWLIFVGYLLAKMNLLMRRQVTERNYTRLTVVFLLVASEMVLLNVFTVDQSRGLIDHLRIQRFSGQAPSFLTVLWIVLMYDVLSKHISLGVKAIWLMISGRCVPMRKTSQVINLQEALFSMHRDMLPIPLWYVYLGSTSAIPLLSWMAQLTYLCIKASRATHNVFVLLSVAKGFALHQSPYGTYVKPEELVENDQGEGGVPQCSICHEDFCDPIRTKCRHIFCEKCLEDWLEREVTCPLCRAVVTSSVGVSRGSTVSALPTMF